MTARETMCTSDRARLLDAYHRNPGDCRLERAAQVAAIVLVCLGVAANVLAQPPTFQAQPPDAQEPPKVEAGSPQYLEGLKLVKAGSFSDAVSALGKAVEKDPKDTAALSLRAFAWSALGERDKSMADYNEAIRVEPKTWGLYANRAAAWQGQGEYAKAVADYSEAIRLDPKNGHLHTNRASVLNEMGEYDKALDDLKEAIRLDPKDVFALVNRAAAEHGKGAYEKAIADLKEAVRLNASLPDAYNGLAWLQATCPDVRLRDGQEAYKNARRAYLITNGMNASYIDTLAAAYAECSDFDDACTWQAKAIEMLKVEKDKEEGRSRLKLYKSGKPYREGPTAK